MCLGVPGRVEKVEGTWAEVSYGSVRTRISVALVPEVQPGEFVIVHAGFAIAKVNQEEAEETLRILGELGAS